MEVIVILGWIDGFGADTEVWGICDSLEKAREIFPIGCADNPIKYQIVNINTECNLDYYEADYLHPEERY